MIHLDVNTGFNFLRSYGSPEQIIARAKEIGSSAVGIADMGATWSHIPFIKPAKKEGIKIIYGVKLPVVSSLDKDPRHDLVTILAMSEDGLYSQYELVSLATSQFYYRPRVTWDQLARLRDNFVIVNRVSDNNERHIRDNYYIAARPVGDTTLRLARSGRYNVALATSPVYPRPEDAEAYRMVSAIGSGRKVRDVDDVANWMFREGEVIAKFAELGIPSSDVKKWIETSELIGEKCNASLPKGTNVKPGLDTTVEEWCLKGAVERGIDLNQEPYKSRYAREIELIYQKGFQDYFLLIGDLIAWAKQRMFVGPARGSSAGSLVCYLMGIVEVNPMQFGLLFERFIDINREDLPDIDIDFPDDQREQVFKYIIDKYGADRVARIGTISVFKPKSALNDVGKVYSIPKWEIEKLTEVMVERSGGDARANMAIEDTIKQFEVGRELVVKYPKVMMATRIEGHPRHTGVHAAGVIVSNDDVNKYAAMNKRDGAYIAMLNKNDAESVGLLKIDALGLKTLAVIQDCCEQVGIDPRSLYTIPLDDPAAYEIFQSDKVAGVFQFEGYAVRSLMRQMGVEEFNDIVALTALARPGPLHCGAANEFIERRIGKVDWDYFLPELKPHVSHTYGTIVYQEQVMSITRDLGGMSWQDVSALRKAMSKSLGEEFFNQFRDKFVAGTDARGIDRAKALQLWTDMCTFGSWAFNLSHAVSYALVSYWCAYLKAKYPLQFAVAHLRRTASEDHILRLLRELIGEGIKFIPFDPDVSQKSWSIHDGKLYGGFTAVKGIGDKTADLIMAVRDKHGGGDWISSLKPGQRTKLLTPNNTPWHNLNRLGKLYRGLYDDPDNYITERTPKGVTGPVLQIDQIKEFKGNYCFIGTLKQRNLRDLNETQSLAKRGGEIVHTNNLFLNLTFEDDTGSILCSIDRWKYPNIGLPLMEGAADGKDFLVRGTILQDGWRKIYISKIVKLSPDEEDDD